MHQCTRAKQVETTNPRWLRGSVGPAYRQIHTHTHTRIHLQEGIKNKSFLIRAKTRETLILYALLACRIRTRKSRFFLTTRNTRPYTNMCGLCAHYFRHISRVAVSSVICLRPSGSNFLAKRCSFSYFAVFGIRLQSVPTALVWVSAKHENRNECVAGAKPLFFFCFLFVCACVWVELREKLACTTVPHSYCQRFALFIDIFCTDYIFCLACAYNTSTLKRSFLGEIYEFSHVCRNLNLYVLTCLRWP